jgi:hypothetical protein
MLAFSSCAAPCGNWSGPVPFFSSTSGVDI